MKITLAVIAVLVVIAGIYWYVAPTPAAAPTDYKSAIFTIEGVEGGLGGNLKYFGNELRKDLNGDGKEDVAFLVTNSPGGSGTFFYVVAAVATDKGYEGSDGYLLGDRIAPQTTESGEGKQVIVNYADRKAGEPFTTQPSVGKSVYLLLDPATMQWGIVDHNFTGEANPAVMTLTMKTWNWVSALYNDGTKLEPMKAGVFTITFGSDGHFSATTDCNAMGGSYSTNQSAITFSNIYATKKYCANSQENDFSKILANASGYLFTSKGELVLDLKYDSGTATFR